MQSPKLKDGSVCNQVPPLNVHPDPRGLFLHSRTVLFWQSGFVTQADGWQLSGKLFKVHEIFNATSIVRGCVLKRVVQCSHRAHNARTQNNGLPSDPVSVSTTDTRGKISYTQLTHTDLLLSLSCAHYRWSEKCSGCVRHSTPGVGKGG